jgi:glyoxylase I family protein
VSIAGMTPLLQVYDMPEALAFYRDVLGFRVVAASPEVAAPEGNFSHWMALERDGLRLMLNTAYDEGERPAQRIEAQQRWHGDVCLYFACTDVDAMYEEVRGKLANVAAPSNASYGMRQLHFSDPDGYAICFQAPVS